MKDETLFSRRSFILSSLQGLAFCGIIGKLTYLQLIDNEKYQRLSNDNRIVLMPILPIRGLIFDRDGLPIVKNKNNYQVVLVAQLLDMKDLHKNLSALKKIFPFFNRDVSWVKKRIEALPRYAPLPLIDDLSWDEFSRFSLQEASLDGIKSYINQKRFYLDGEAFAPITGYLGKITQSQNKIDIKLKSHAPLLKIGLTGLEKKFEEDLRGEAGQVHIEVDARRRPVRKLLEFLPTDGKHLSLTLHAPLQRATFDLLKDTPASCLVINVKTGAILICVSTPSFDPNTLSSGLDKTYWEKMIHDPRKPLLNRALFGLYPPGSCLKPVVALGALALNHESDETIVCSGSYTLGKHTFHCWNRQGHGPVTMHQALVHSCDVYFYKMAQKIGIESIAKLTRTFGLGRSFDIGLGPSKSGLVPDKLWKRSTLSENWHLGDTIISAIGQGFMLATPLHLAVMAGRLASRNVHLMPFLLKDDAPSSFTNEEGTPNLPEEYWDIIHNAMHDVINNPEGTGRNAHIPGSPWQMAGKTGTAQIHSLKRNKADTDIPWHKRDHALFIGYAPSHNPLYAISLLMEHQVHTGTSAVPLARDVMQMVMEEHIQRWQ